MPFKTAPTPTYALFGAASHADELRVMCTDESLSRPAHKLLLGLLLLADKDLSVSLTRPRLAQFCGLSMMGIENARLELEQAGYLIRIRVIGKPHTYRLIASAQDASSQDTHAVDRVNGHAGITA